MAEEPQPETVRSGADAAKAAAALDSLDRNNDDESPSKSADQEALGKAMASLDVKDSGVKEGKKEAPKKVKIDAEDVKLLVGFVRMRGVDRCTDSYVYRCRNWRSVRSRLRRC